ncbi:MAG: hypothetical protein DRO88_02425 [Promethearchaeia archaeon]|nr:MAG: hypothetical protein DRO88_02425 [Candidatus Lokiarchaeia archaeon]
MPATDNFRHHNPDEPIKRNPLIKVFVFFVELMIVWQGYYVFRLISNQFEVFLNFSKVHHGVFLMPLSFWLGVLYIMILSKLFNRYIVLIAVISAEWFFEQFIFDVVIQPVVLGYLAYLIIIESLTPYKGGDYYQTSHFLKQIGEKILYILGFLPILYFGFIFQSPIPFFSSDGFQIRLYLCLNFLLNNLFLIIPAWLTFWILDRALQPCFPLDKSDKVILQALQADQKQNKYEALQAEDTNGSRDRKFLDLYQQVLPQPGEVYLQILTHHSLEDDDHTIVVPLGKVRVYFCTRCTAMIFGVIFTFLLSMILFHDFNLPIDTNVAFWLGVILPIFPLLDWGLQALKIRKATTASRLITGFILGVSMQFIPFAIGESLYYLLVVVGYFTIFFFLYIIRSKMARKEADEQTLQDFAK